MKLSELKGERAVEVIADLIEPIANIASDQKNLQLFKNKQKEGESLQELGIREVKEKLPKLLKTHKQDVLAIICTINDVEPEDLNMFDIIDYTVELANDKELRNLFLSVNGKKEAKQPTESSVNAEHTEPEQ